MAVLSSLAKYKDTGLLIMRAGLGVMFMYHGYPKLFGGPEFWGKIGQAMGTVGISFLPVVWGLLAAIAEAVGGLFILIGFLFRPASFFLLFTMAIATCMHLKSEGLMQASHALELAFVFAGLLFTGPGKYSVDKK
ncbi:MAG: DoxX family protein [Mucilaginibacter polytrichastri]|nr:DoxX family protein [Mucilaginibacter polytrichastri]